MNKEILISELARINIKLSNLQLKQIEKFCLFLLEENQKYNLTAIRDYEEVLLKHVYDSLTLSLVLDLSKPLRLLDIGSGAGFPGIIIKIVYPHLKITLLDSNGKKTHFLEEVKKFLNLDDLDIVNDRAEEYILKQRETYDLVTARAVSSLNILVELAIPFLKVNGLFIAMKGNIESELQLGMETCLFLNAKIKEQKEFLLPIENSKRTLVVIEKVAITDKKYPRNYDQIIKKPLKINKK